MQRAFLNTYKCNKNQKENQPDNKITPKDPLTIQTWKLNNITMESLDHNADNYINHIFTKSQNYTCHKTIHVCTRFQLWDPLETNRASQTPSKNKLQTLVFDELQNMIPYQPYAYSTQSTSNDTAQTLRKDTKHDTITFEISIHKKDISSNIVLPSTPNQYPMVRLDLPISLQHLPFTPPYLTYFISLQPCLRTKNTIVFFLKISKG